MSPDGAPQTRVAVVGTSHWHLPLYLPGLAESHVVGVWDRDATRAERLAASMGTQAFGSRAALLDQGVELAFVFGSPWDMLEHSKECIRRGISISVEKPAAPSLSDLEQLVVEVDRAGVSAFVPLVFRLSGMFDVFEQLGRVSELHALYLTGPGSRYVSGGHAWAVTDSVLGAGAMGNLGPHFVDLFSRLVGTADHDTKYAETRRPGPALADERALVVLGSADGPSATIDLGYTTPHAQSSVGPSIVVTGSLGMLSVNDAMTTLTRVDGTVSHPFPPLRWPDLFREYVRAAVGDAVGSHDLPDLADLRDAYRVLGQIPA